MLLVVMEVVVVFRAVVVVITSVASLVRFKLWWEALVLRHTGVITVVELSPLRTIAVMVMTVVMITVVRWLLLLCRLTIFLRGSVF